MLFSLREEIRKKLQSGHEPRPGAIADTIAEEVPGKYLRLALSQALPYLVRDEVRKVRHAALGDHTGERGPESLAAVASAERDPDAGPGTPGRPGTSATRPGGSRAFTIFEVPLSFGPGNWKYLGDCTREEIIEAAEFLAKRAEDNQSRADAYQRLAEYMEENDIEKVRDAEPEKVRELVDPEQVAA